MRKIFELHGLVSVDGLEKVQKGLENIDKSLKKASVQLIKTGKNFEKIGVGFTKYLTAPVVAAGAAITKFGADFEKSMTTSLAIMGNVSDEMQKKMGDTAKAVSEQTTFSASEAAKAYYYLASAGMNAAQSISALPRVAKFATAGQFDLARATDLLTDAQSALGLSSKNVAENEENLVRVSDVLVKANTLANASVEQFSESLTTRAGAALKILGKDVEEGVAVLAAYADQGTKGAEAGTQLGIVLRDLQKAALENKNTFKSAGISVYDANGEMRNMSDIIGELENALSGMSDEQKKATLSMLGFQEKSVASLLTLVGTSEKIKEYEESLRKAAGTTDEVSKKQLQNFWDQLTIIRNRLVNVAISLSEQLLPVLKNDVIPIIENAVEKIRSMADAFSRLDPQTRSNTLKFIAFAAVLGPMLLVLGKVITVIGSLRGAVLLLNAAFLSNPIGQVIVAISLAVAAVSTAIGMWKNWNEQIEENSKLMRENIRIRTVEQAQIEDFTTKFDDLTKRMLSNKEALKDEALYTSLYGKEIEDLAQEAQKMGYEIQGNTADHYNLISAFVSEMNFRKSLNQETKTYAELLEQIKKKKEKPTKATSIIDVKELEKEQKLIEDLERNNFEVRKRWGEETKKEEEARIAAIREKNTQAVKEWEEQNRRNQEQIELEKQQRINALNAVISAVQGLGNTIQMYYDSQRESIDINYEKERSRIERLNVSEEERAKLLENLDEQTAKKKKALRRKEAILEKAMGIFSIGVNTATAIMNAWATLAPPFAIAMSIIIGALGAVQTAIVAAKPIPAAKGLYVKSDLGRGITTQVGEGRENELVMPLETGAKALVDNLIREVNSRPIETTTINKTTNQTLRPVTLNIGTLIADEAGIKELERRMSRIKVVEAQRMGAAT